MDATDLTDALHDLRWKQVDLARKLGLHVNTVSAWATGAKSPRRHSPPRASGAQMASGGSVVVQVNGRSVLIPEHALRDGLSDLRLATGVCVGLEDYTEGVALILSALDKSGVIQFPSGHLAHK